MRHSQSRIVKAAIEYGCKTAKDFAHFIKTYNPEVEINKGGKEIVYLSLFR